jgi:hypothetical protein
VKNLTSVLQEFDFLLRAHLLKFGVAPSTALASIVVLKVTIFVRQTKDLDVNKV